MHWVMDLLGPEGVVYAGFSIKDHARVAIQQLSGEVPTRVVYTHTGFREIAGHGPVFLHAGGAIGKAGIVAGIEGGRRRA